MDLPSIEQTFIQSLWRRIPLKVRFLSAIAAMLFIVAMLIGAFSAIHDHGYNKGQVATDKQSQVLRDEINQYKGREPLHIQKEQELQRGIDDRDRRIVELEGKVAEDEKNTEKTRTIYRTITNRPVPIRPVGIGLSDRELSRDATEQGIDLNRSAVKTGAP